MEYHNVRNTNPDRRRFSRNAGLTFAAAQLATMRSANAHGKNLLAANAPATHTSFVSLKQIDAGLLNVGYAEAAPRTGYVDVAPLLAARGFHVIVPFVRGCGSTTFLSGATFRNGEAAAAALDVIAFMDALKIDKAVFGAFDWGGTTADIIGAIWPERALGYDKYRHDFGKLIWKLASPKWNFDDATFDRTAKSFDNPDYVAIAIHNYRWRLGPSHGESKYAELENRIDTLPVITVPTITMEGDANGAPHDPPATYRDKFSGKYEHRLITGGVGHNLPQEAPQAFAKAIVDVAAFRNSDE